MRGTEVAASGLNASQQPFTSLAGMFLLALSTRSVFCLTSICAYAYVFASLHTLDWDNCWLTIGHQSWY